MPAERGRRAIGTNAGNEAAGGIVAEGERPRGAVRRDNALCERDEAVLAVPGVDVAAVGEEVAVRVVGERLLGRRREHEALGGILDVAFRFGENGEDGSGKERAGRRIAGGEGSAPRHERCRGGATLGGDAVHGDDRAVRRGAAQCDIARMEDRVILVERVRRIDGLQRKFACGLR